MSLCYDNGYFDKEEQNETKLIMSTSQPFEVWYFVNSEMKTHICFCLTCLR